MCLSLDRHQTFTLQKRKIAAWWTVESASIQLRNKLWKFFKADWVFSKSLDFQSFFSRRPFLLKISLFICSTPWLKNITCLVFSKGNGFVLKSYLSHTLWEKKMWGLKFSSQLLLNCIKRQFIKSVWTHLYFSCLTRLYLTIYVYLSMNISN